MHTRPRVAGGRGEVETRVATLRRAAHFGRLGELPGELGGTLQEPEGRAEEGRVDLGATIGVPFSLPDSPPLRVHLQRILIERLLWVLRLSGEPWSLPYGTWSLGAETI